MIVVAPGCRPADQGGGDRGREHGLAARGRADAGEQVGGRGVLEQVAAGPGLEGAEDVGLGVVGGQDQDLRRRGQRPQGGGHLDATGLAGSQTQIHQYDVGPVGRHHGDAPIDAGRPRR